MKTVTALFVTVAFALVATGVPANAQAPKSKGAEKGFIGLPYKQKAVVPVVSKTHKSH